MKQLITVYLCMRQKYKADYSGMDWAPDLWSFKPSPPDSEDRIYIGERQVEIDLPDDFNPVPAQVRALEAEKAEALAKYQRSVAEINERLANLTAIGCEVI